MSDSTLTQYQNGVNQVSGNQLNTFMQTCDSVAQLKNFVGLPDIEIWLRGFVVPNDGGQGNFYWNPTGTGPDDGGVTYVVPYGSIQGCWTRQTPVTGSGITFHGAVTAGDLVTVYSSGQLQDFGPPPADFLMFFPGVPLLSAYMVELEMDRTIVFPVNLTGSVASSRVASTSSSAITMYKNASAIGTINWINSTTTGAFTFASAVTFVSGDVLTLQNQNPADATLADIRVSLKGTRSN